MKTVILFRPNSEHARRVQDYLRDFERQTGKKIMQMDVDSVEGIDTCRLYDIVSYPAILATDNEGHIQQIWQDNFPTISELSYYV
ncbi:MAG TPA: hypothetical protein VNX65_01000 [Patescibacteria group bacterium]|jgi:hypothetical protein|nr:hypothetical protein [Patescibacteria group bacterium]